LDFDQAICGTVAARREPIVATHLQQAQDARSQLAKELNIRVYACNPLLAGDRLLGTLSFASRRRDEFDAHEIEFLETVSHYVTLCYQRTYFVRALRENDRRKDEFLATLAHELRNPLAPIRAGVELIKVAGNDPAIMSDVRSTMERQVRHMVHLIDDLMDVSRITRGKLALRPSRVDLSSVLQSAVDATRGFFQNSNQQLTVSLPNEPLYLHADPTRLSQVFSNLLNNAAKYTPDGGSVAVAVERRGNQVSISVKDNGLGIPDDMRNRIFEMFTQVDTAPERRHGGLGIGLTLVKSLVEMHGGTVSVRSDGPGKGSEFVVGLPLLSGPAVERFAEPEAPLQGSARRHRIVVVDDNKDAAKMLSMNLLMFGSEVYTAFDGQQAMELAARVRPDVVVMDIGMPGMSGYDTARRMRGESWGKDILLIALTGWGQQADRQRATSAGFDHHFVKPLEAATLRKILARRDSSVR
jgi:signal transduction histidine kinase/CheY-like chemotaxis protein